MSTTVPRTRIVVLLAASCTVALAGATSRAADKTTLRWKFTPGQKIHYEMTHESVRDIQAGEGKQKVNAQIKTSETWNVTWQVKSVDDDGTAHVVNTFDRMRTASSGGPAPPVDVDSKADRSPSNPGVKLLFDLFLNQPISMSINPTGKVSDIELPQSMLDKLEEAKKRAPQGGMFSEAGVKERLSQGVQVFPDHSLARGDSWETTSSTPDPLGQKQTVKTQNKYDGPEDRHGKMLDKIVAEQKVEFSPPKGLPVKMKIVEQHSDGVTYFDPEQGLVTSSVLKGKVKMNLEGQGAKSTMTMTDTNSLKLVSEADANKPAEKAPTDESADET